MVTASTSQVLPNVKGNLDAETSGARSEIPATTKHTSLTYLAFGVDAHGPPHPLKSQVGRDLPGGSAMGSIPTKLEDIDPVTIAVLSFSV